LAVIEHMAENFLDIAQRLLTLPTAPYHEHYIVAAVLRFAEEKRVDVCSDEFGNLTLKSKDASPSGLCLTAHLDHPALGFPIQETSREVLFERLGGVPTALAQDAGVLVYSTQTTQGEVPEPIARGRVTALLQQDPGSSKPHAKLRVHVDQDLPDMSDDKLFAIWDLPACEIEDDRLVGIACDDLAGVAVALTTLERCAERDVGISILLTRAEETGFGGMLAAVDAGQLDTEAVYVNIECSSCRAGAPLGDGPVIRIGDRRWVFDAGVTEALTACAGQLQKEDGFRVQRRLMDGGVCEATPLSRSGRATGAVALPLDNYHNHGGDRLQSEAVHTQDAENLIKLLTHFAQQPKGPRGLMRESAANLDRMLETRRIAQSERLRQTVPTLPGP
jgi:endoglucanase